MLAEDDGGGGGGDDAGTDTSTDVVHDAMPPELLPDPFSGSSDLDSSGDVITVPSNGVQGPVPAEGQDKYTAWNARAGADADAAVDPAMAPDPAPAATAKGFGTLALARSGYEALAAKFAAYHSKTHATAKLNAQLQAELKKTRLSNVAAIQGKVAAETKLKAVTAERDTLKEREKTEPQRINAAAQRLLAADGRPPVNAAIDTEGKTKPEKKDHSQLKGLDRTRAAFAEQLAKFK